MISVLGVYNADLKFRVGRFPDPGETLHGISFEVQPGGKGFNQAVAAMRASLNTGETGEREVVMLTQLGNDNFGTMATSFMEQERLDASHISYSDELPTGTAMIMVEEPTGQNKIVIAPGAASLIGAEDVNAKRDVIATSSHFVTNFELPIAAARAGLETARDCGVTTVLDPAPASELPRDIYELVDILTPNESEAAILVGGKVEDLEDGARAGLQLCSWGVRHAIITMGEKGVVWVNNENVRMFRAFELEDVVDTTGAGDAFNGALVSRLAAGAQMEDAIVYASAAAAICVGKFGAADAMATGFEIKEFLRDHKMELKL